jgi:hypothetical protein
MLFEFLKYVQPTWYFNLTPKDSSYFLDYRLLSSELKDVIRFDNDYVLDDYKLRDAAYQALLKGIIDCTSSCRLKYDSKYCVKDEYRFLRKYFHPVWSVYVLFVRLITFHNPVSELVGFLNSLFVSRVHLFEKTVGTESPDGSSQSLTKERPSISVIIPTLNRYEYLADVLEDLEQQEYPNFEVIVVDQSFVFDEEFYKQYNLKLRIIRQDKPGLWQARNTGVKIATSEYIAFCEDDVRVNPNWLSEHLKCLETFDCDISAGVFYLKGTSLPQGRLHFRWADQFASGNALVKKAVFFKVGLFDLQFEKMRMGDGEFGARCFVNGVKSVSNPFASCVDVKAGVGGLRQMGSWDSFRPTSWLAPRPIPSVLYYYRKYFGLENVILDLVIKMPASVIPFRFKRNTKLLLFGSICSVFLMPIFFIQLGKSWRISTEMIREGSLIEKFQE